MFLSLHLSTDEEIKALNLRWRGKNKATDVLSFVAQEGEKIPVFDFVLGDVVISVETAKKQAKQQGHKTHQEIAVLFVHGIMHLLGLDHERDAESAIRQVECEMALLDRADINPLFALTRRSF
jgi:probable rRNA maturation factor